jgi:hypothetical protein
MVMLSSLGHLVLAAWLYWSLHGQCILWCHLLAFACFCLLLLAFAPFKLIVPPSTLTSLRPPTHPLDGDAAPPLTKAPPLTDDAP